METVTDPAYLFTRGMEDFVAWPDGTKTPRNIQRYREKVDHVDLL
jgi:U3 small nucleolar ribonucleoprotein protein IMP3